MEAPEFLKEAWKQTRKTGAPGIDGKTAEEYEENLGDNLKHLLERFKTGTYRAPPVRRTYIPKNDGRKERPIGIPTIEDKILQRAVKMILEAVYEQDFLDCSHGFRPKRSAHTALEELWHTIMKMGGGYVFEVDIKGYFDTIDHRKLRSFLDQRVKDGVIRRILDKWLKAGVMEEGCIKHPESGTPQGGVISPLLANIYLHEVLDKWFEDTVKPRLKGTAQLIRYADDFVIVFEKGYDARRVERVLPKRFDKYSLTINLEKTRLLSFRRPKRNSEDRSKATFELLGFTHYWGKSHKGSWVLKRKTSSRSYSRFLRNVTIWMKEHRHSKWKDQHTMISMKLRGHFGYFGITGNAASLRRIRWETERIMRKWRNRRSQRNKTNWQRFTLAIGRYPLPKPRVVHSLHYASAKP